MVHVEGDDDVDSNVKGRVSRLSDKESITFSNSTQTSGTGHVPYQVSSFTSRGEATWLIWA